MNQVFAQKYKVYVTQTILNEYEKDEKMIQ